MVDWCVLAYMQTVEIQDRRMKWREGGWAIAQQQSQLITLHSLMMTIYPQLSEKSSSLKLIGEETIVITLITRLIFVVSYPRKKYQY